MVRIFTRCRRPFGTITKVIFPNGRRHYAFHLVKYTRCFACFAIQFCLAFLLIEAQFAGLARCPWLAKVWYDGSSLSTRFFFLRYVVSFQWLGRCFFCPYDVLRLTWGRRR